MSIFQRIDKDGNASWYIDFYYNGKRIREVAGHTKRQAEDALAMRKAEILQGKYGIVNGNGRKIRFNELAET